MKFNLSRIVIAGLVLSGFIFKTVAQSDTDKPLKGKPEFYFKMNTVEEGRHLIKKLGCNDCHTAGYLKSNGNVPVEKWLTGDTFGWRGPLGTTYGSNLRLLINVLQEEDWIGMAKALRSRPPMPHPILNAMNNEELKAIYWFIRYLGPSGKPAPDFLPPG